MREDGLARKPPQTRLPAAYALRTLRPCCSNVTATPIGYPGCQSEVSMFRKSIATLLLLALPALPAFAGKPDNPGNNKGKGNT